MAQWEQVQHLPHDYLKSIQDIYDRQFPLDVRHHLADYLEKVVSDSEIRNPLEILHTIVERLDDISENCSLDGRGFVQKITLQNASDTLKELYESNPVALINKIKTCLAREQNVLQEAQNENIFMDQDLSRDNENYTHINENLRNIHEKVVKCGELLKKLKHKLENYQLECQTFQTYQSSHQTLIERKNRIKPLYEAGKLQNEDHIAQYEKMLDLEKKQKVALNEFELKNVTENHELEQTKCYILNVFKENLALLSTTQRLLLDEQLPQWKRNQQLSGNGVPFHFKFLDTIQKWVEQLAELIYMTKRDVMSMDNMRANLFFNDSFTAEELQKNNAEIMNLLSTLVTSTFVVEVQPPQVLKKDAKFSATARLLIGDKLNMQMNPPKVSAFVISENQARNLGNKERNKQLDLVGNILNNVGQMEFNQNTGVFSITFKNMKLNTVKRTDRRGQEQAVTEEKSCIVFQAEFNIANELKINVQTISLPVVVTVHGNQECHALATVLWDNQFAEPCRLPFVVPENVPWRDVAEMLSSKFKAMTGKGLSLDNTNYLASKILGPGPDYSQEILPWHKFNREPMAGRSFTFWEWTYGVMKLLRESLKNFWQDGTIVGFISKNQAQDMLSNKPNGTFVLRFSDSETGGITIAWIRDINNNQGFKNREVLNLVPYTVKDFQIRNLSDRIRDLEDLVYLYPDVPKDQVFGQYMSVDQNESTPKTKIPYVKRELRECLPGSVCQNAQRMDVPSPGSQQGLFGATNIITFNSELDDDSFNSINYDGLDYNPEDIRMTYDQHM